MVTRKKRLSDNQADKHRESEVEILIHTHTHRQNVETDAKIIEKARKIVR